tara:strand:- start:1096 stop:1452 length:357 start_codon:yes stop_codon:yes gene_type:complete
MEFLEELAHIVRPPYLIVEGDTVIKDSPWGPITLATRKSQGIWFISTDSHGGFWLSPERREELPEEMKGTSFLNKSHGDEWWEEDCDAQRIASWADFMSGLPVPLQVTSRFRQLVDGD